MVHLIHQHVNPHIQASGHTFVQHLFKALLLLRSWIEEVIAVGEFWRDELSLVEYINHLLNEITYVDKFEKGNEWSNMVVGSCGARIVGGEVLDGFVKASFDMAGAEDLEKCYKDRFALLFSVRKNSSVFAENH